MMPLPRQPLLRLALAASLTLALALVGLVLVQQQGPARGYWGDGVRRWQGEGRPGQESGEWSYWYRNGQLRERGSYEAARKVGVWEQWHSNGQRATVGERVWSPEANASVRQGPWTTWHENGDPASEGSYDRGARAGLWSFWRVAGGRTEIDEARSGHYEAGRRVE